jgi:flagellar hook assembly protein FlgD
VTLNVYSIAGRLVRALLDGEIQTPGPYRIQWDGKDERGRSVASGVYYYKLEANGEILTNRMVLLK